MLISGLLRRFVSTGHLRIIDARNRVHDFGTVGETPSVAVRFHDPGLVRRIALNPRLAVGEAYMDGTLTIEDGTIVDFWEVVGRNYSNLARQDSVGRFATWLRRYLLGPMQQYNPVGRAGATSPITMTSRTNCSISFSTRTGSIPAPTSPPPTTRWTRPRRTRSGTLRPSFSWNPA